MPDLLRVDSNQRVDIADFQHAVNDVQDAMGRLVPEHFLTTPSGQQLWILHGFAPTNPAASQLQVTRGAAILKRREGAQVYSGVIAAEGDASQIVDMASFSPGTYGIYIRFEYQDGASQSRVFWNPAGGGQEFAQTVSTRKQANWSLRVESGTPGTDWMKIGEVDQATMAITDQRDFYFEGNVADSYAPRWGSGNDRDADRAQYGVRDLQTFVDSTHQILGEIKGGNWWERGVDDGALSDKIQITDFQGSNSLGGYVSGYGLTQDGGLDITIADGIGYAEGKRVALSDATGSGWSTTLTNNLDNYIELRGDGTFDVQTVAIGGTPPVANGLRLWAVTCSGGAITGTRDWRIEYPVVHSREDLPRWRITEYGDAPAALTRTMAGLELVGEGMGPSYPHTPAVKFMSSDSAFTTETPKLLATIVGTASEFYSADTDGGMHLDFRTTPNAPGATSLPVHRVRITEAGQLQVGAISGTPIDSGTEMIRVYVDAANALVSQKFQNQTTGTVGNAGMEIGLDSNQDAFVWNSENKSLYLGANNQQRATLQSAGDFVIWSGNGVDESVRLHGSSARGLLTLTSTGAPGVAFVETTNETWYTAVDADRFFIARSSTAGANRRLQVNEYGVGVNGYCADATQRFIVLDRTYVTTPIMIAELSNGGDALIVANTPVAGKDPGFVWREQGTLKWSHFCDTSETLESLRLYNPTGGIVWTIHRDGHNEWTGRHHATHFSTDTAWTGDLYDVAKFSAYQSSGSIVFLGAEIGSTYEYQCTLSSSGLQQYVTNTDFILDVYNNNKVIIRNAGSNAAYWNNNLTYVATGSESYINHNMATHGIFHAADGATGVAYAYADPDVYHVFRSRAAGGDTSSSASRYTVGAHMRTNANGGYIIRGFAESTTSGLTLEGYMTTVNTSAAGSAIAPITLNSVVSNGSVDGVISVTATGNLLVLNNNYSNRLVVKGDGDLYIAGTYEGPFDAEQDAVACRDASQVMAYGPDAKVWAYNKDRLEKLGIMENGFVSTRRMQALMLGGIGELYLIVDHICGKLGLSYEQLRQELRAQ